MNIKTTYEPDVGEIFTCPHTNVKLKTIVGYDCRGCYYSDDMECEKSLNIMCSYNERKDRTSVKFKKVESTPETEPFDLTNPGKVPLEKCPKWVRIKYKEAHGNGLEVHFKSITGTGWIIAEGVDPNMCMWSHKSFRIPPQPERIPFTKNNIPLYRMFKDKESGEETCAIGYDDYFVTLIKKEPNSNNILAHFCDYKTLFEHYEISHDYGKTWKPAGTLVS
jgi:hypothetical protein